MKPKAIKLFKPQISDQSARLTRLPVFGHGLPLHLGVDGHHGDAVLGVRLQVLQHSAGGGSRNRVLSRGENERL